MSGPIISKRFYCRQPKPFHNAYLRTKKPLSINWRPNGNWGRRSSLQKREKRSLKYHLFQFSPWLLRSSLSSSTSNMTYVLSACPVLSFLHFLYFPSFFQWNCPILLVFTLKKSFHFSFFLFLLFSLISLFFPLKTSYSFGFHIERKFLFFSFFSLFLKMCYSSFLLFIP